MSHAEEMQHYVADTQQLLSSVDSLLQLARTPEQVENVVSELRSQARSYMDVCRRDIERFADNRNGLAIGVVLAGVGAASILTQIPKLVGAAVAVAIAISTLRLHLTYALKLEEAKTLEQFWSGLTALRIAPENAWRWMPSSGLKTQRISQLLMVYLCAWGIALYQCTTIATTLGRIETSLVAALFLLMSIQLREDWKSKIRGHANQCRVLMRELNDNLYPKYLSMISAAFERVNR